MKNMFRVLCFLFLAFTAGGANAAFSLSGTTITQTGTDANLSGLVGVAGVTVSAQQGIDVYNIGNRRLVIQGTLTIDPEQESLIVGYNTGDLIQVTGNGHLIIGQEIVQNGFSRFSEGLAIFLEDTPTGFNDRFSFSGNSSFTWNGGFISMYAGKFGFYGDNVTVRINSVNAKLLYRTQDPQNQIRQETDDFISQAFSFINGDFTIVGTGQQLNGYEPTHATGSIAFSGATPNVDVTLRGYSGGDRGNAKDIKLWQGGRPILINSKTGSELNLGSHLPGDNSSFGVARVFQEFDLKVTDTLNNPIQNAMLYIRDTDNGNRGTYTRENPSINFTADNVYIAATDNNGDIATQQILLASNVANNGNNDAPNTGVYAWDYRGKNNDNSDLFEAHVWSYNHLYQLLRDIELKGVEGTAVATKLLADNVTEPDIAVVNAYTTINNLDRLYDRAKAWKVLSANLEYPAIDEQVITNSGSVLNLGNRNLVVDGTAIGAFSVNTGTDTVTIRSGAMNCTGGNFSRLTTTGTITFINGAAPGTCIFTDSVGTNGVVTLTGLNNANLLVFDDAAVGDDTISYQTDVSGNIEIPFNATVSTDYRIVVRREGYSEVNFEFDPSAGGFFTFPISQFRSLTIEGTPIYANTGNVSRVDMDFATLKINIGDFTLPAQEFYDTLQDYEVTEDGMKAPRIANYDGDDRVLLLNAYQMRSRDGVSTVPGVNGFIFAETGTVLDATNGTVQYLANDSATVDKQEQIIKMLEGLQGSAWDNNAEVYAVTFGNLSEIIGTGFVSANDSLSSIIDRMFIRGILDVNTAKDLVR